MAPTAKRTSAAAIGIISLLFGAFLRFAARDIAWPNNFSYSGPRENTIWAIKEQAYADSGLVLMIFGLSVFLVVLVNWLWSSSTENRP